MRIDCHCHIFDNDCVPLSGMLASRFGVAVGKRAAKLISDLKGGRLDGSLRDYFREVSIDPGAVLNSMIDPQEKDNFLFILKHLSNFPAFLKIGAMDMPWILNRMKHDSPGVDIWVPLMMDMTHAYPGSQPAISFETQREVMTRLTLEAKGRVMPFFAFDPRSGPADPVEKAKTAIETQGFVGIKLYPPLGYKPVGNDDPKVEDALMRLYRYCCSNENNLIPITVHCSWSAGVYSNEHVPGVTHIKTYYRNFARPSYWRNVLQKFPKLKLNLAHFGGLGEWEALSKGNAPRENWVEPILGLIKDHDNVYTDLSYHGIPTTDLAEGYKRVLIERINGLEHKVLLGSDWYMSRMQCTLDDYWKGFETLLSDLFYKMTGENAIAFLKSEATTKFFPRFFYSNQSMILDQYQNLF